MFTPTSKGLALAHLYCEKLKNAHRKKCTSQNLVYAFSSEAHRTTKMKQVISFTRTKVTRRSAITGAWKSSCRKHPLRLSGLKVWNYAPSTASSMNMPSGRRRTNFSAIIGEARTPSFEEFTHSRFDDPEYNPTLWAVAGDGDEIAGFSINRFRMGIGWFVHSASAAHGAKRDWAGPASIFLWRVLQAWKLTIGLGVDASNPTGATRLYQRAGMYVASEFVTYEKELRAGRTLEE